LFYTKEVNSAGCYLVYFFVNGIKTPVVIDDYFPVTEWGALAFSSSKDGEIWVSLLEKAWAKLHGSYARVEGGSPHFAFSQLCGLPGYFESHSKLEDVVKFWRQLQDFDKRNFIMLAATHGQGENKNDAGIISGHAYSVIRVIEFRHLGKQVRLLQLRNPWGKGEWKGDWSDESPLWTDELRQRYNVQTADDGCFYIPLEAYL